MSKQAAPSGQTTPFASPLPHPLRKAAAAAQPIATGNISKPTRGVPAADRPAKLPPATALPSSKSLFGSYRSLSPNTRILFGLAIGAVGLAGLYWDRTTTLVEDAPGDSKPLINIRTVERPQ